MPKYRNRQTGEVVELPNGIEPSEETLDLYSGIFKQQATPQQKSMPMPRSAQAVTQAISRGEKASPIEEAMMSQPTEMGWRDYAGGIGHATLKVPDPVAGVRDRTKSAVTEGQADWRDYSPSSTTGQMGSTLQRSGDAEFLPGISFNSAINPIVDLIAESFTPANVIGAGAGMAINRGRGVTGVVDRIRGAFNRPKPTPPPVASRLVDPVKGTEVNSIGLGKPSERFNAAIGRSTPVRPPETTQVPMKGTQVKAAPAKTEDGQISLADDIREALEKRLANKGIPAKGIDDVDNAIAAEKAQGQATQARHRKESEYLTKLEQKADHEEYLAARMKAEMDERAKLHGQKKDESLAKKEADRIARDVERERLRTVNEGRNAYKREMNDPEGVGDPRQAAFRAAQLDREATDAAHQIADDLLQHQNRIQEPFRRDVSASTVSRPPAKPKPEPKAGKGGGVNPYQQAADRMKQDPVTRQPTIGPDGKIQFRTVPEPPPTPPPVAATPTPRDVVRDIMEESKSAVRTATAAAGDDMAARGIGKPVRSTAPTAGDASGPGGGGPTAPGVKQPMIRPLEELLAEAERFEAQAKISKNPKQWLAKAEEFRKAAKEWYPNGPDTPPAAAAAPKKPTPPPVTPGKGGVAVAEPTGPRKPEVKVIFDTPSRGGNRVWIDGVEQTKNFGPGGPTEAEIAQLHRVIDDPQSFKRLQELKNAQKPVPGPKSVGKGSTQAHEALKAKGFGGNVTENPTRPETIQERFESNLRDAQKWAEQGKARVKAATTPQGVKEALRPEPPAIDETTLAQLAELEELSKAVSKQPASKAKAQPAPPPVVTKRLAPDEPFDQVSQVRHGGKQPFDAKQVSGGRRTDEILKDNPRFQALSKEERARRYKELGGINAEFRKIMPDDPEKGAIDINMLIPERLRKFIETRRQSHPLVGDDPKPRAEVDSLIAELGYLEGELRAMPETSRYRPQLEKRTTFVAERIKQLSGEEGSVNIKALLPKRVLDLLEKMRGGVPADPKKFREEIKNDRYGFNPQMSRRGFMDRVFGGPEKRLKQDFDNLDKTSFKYAEHLSNKYPVNEMDDDILEAYIEHRHMTPEEPFVDYSRITPAEQAALEGFEQKAYKLDAIEADRYDMRKGGDSTDNIPGPLGRIFENLKERMGTPKAADPRAVAKAKPGYIDEEDIPYNEAMKDPAIAEILDDVRTNTRGTAQVLPFKQSDNDAALASTWKDDLSEHSYARLKRKLKDTSEPEVLTPQQRPSAEPENARLIEKQTPVNQERLKRIFDKKYKPMGEDAPNITPGKNLPTATGKVPNDPLKDPAVPDNIKGENFSVGKVEPTFKRDPRGDPERGAMTPAMAGAITRSSIGGLAGGAMDASSGDDSAWDGAALGALAGLATHNVSPNGRLAKILEKYDSARYEGMLAGGAQITNIMGNAGGLGLAPVIRLLQGNPMAAKALASALRPSKSIPTLKAGFKRGFDKNNLESTKFGSRPIGPAGRTLRGVDRAVKDLMESGGMTPREAEIMTVSGDPVTRMGKGIELLQSNPLGRQIAPFVRTAINSAELGASLSPLRYGSQALRDLVPAKGPVNEALLAGTGIAAALAGYHGATPNNPSKSAALGPFAFPAQVGAGIRDYEMHGRGGARDLARAVVNQIPFLSDVVRLTENPGRAVTQLVTQPIPAGSYMIDKWTGGGNVKETDGVLDSIKDKIPGIFGAIGLPNRNDLPDRRNFWGEPLERNWLGQYPEPLHSLDDNYQPVDPVAHAAGEAGVLRREPSSNYTLSNAEKQLGYGDLTPHEESRLQELRGAASKQALTLLTQLPEFQQLPLTAQQALMKLAQSQASEKGLEDFRRERAARGPQR